MNKDINNELYGKREHLQPNPVLRFFLRLGSYRIIDKFEYLILMAKEFGLPEVDIEDALSNIEYNEFALAFDMIAEQMYEYDIKTNEEFYELAMKICEILKVEKHKYNFLEELISNHIDESFLEINKNRK